MLIQVINNENFQWMFYAAFILALVAIIRFSD